MVADYEVRFPVSTPRFGLALQAVIGTVAEHGGAVHRAVLPGLRFAGLSIRAARRHSRWNQRTKADPADVFTEPLEVRLPPEALLVPAVYLPCTWLVPGLYLRPRRPPRPVRAARYISALTCAAAARYIAGTRQVQGMW